MKVKMMILLFQIMAISIPMPGSAKVAGRFVQENVALRGKATQSVIYPGEYSPYSHAGNAIDGNRDSQFDHGSCTHTTNIPNPWWRVDLLQPYTITSVTITNRGCCCAERISGAQIHIGDSLENNGINNPQCSVVDSIGLGETKTFNCAKSMMGRYVTVYIPREEFLTLCEVEVNALLPCSQRYC